MFAAIEPLVDIADKFQVLRVKAWIDNEPTRIDESSQLVLRYRTPNFSATATVELASNLCAGTWKVGWIQACSHMIFRCQYGDEGYMNWEFPELEDNEEPMINDCDGSNYPWYGDEDEMAVVQCPNRLSRRVTVAMNDNFHPQVTWLTPSNPNQIEPNLTSIVRNQSFYVWLVAWNITRSKLYILKNFYWNTDLEISIQPRARLGERAKLVSSPYPRQPLVLPFPVSIPRRALIPPNANSAQRLVWYPKKGPPSVIIPPIWPAILT